MRNRLPGFSPLFPGSSTLDPTNLSQSNAKAWAATELTSQVLRPNTHYSQTSVSTLFLSLYSPVYFLSIFPFAVNDPQNYKADGGYRAAAK
jgi:hypothetical protein